MDLELLSSSAYDIQKMIEVSTLEQLARGIYPHGTEGGEDITDLSLINSGNKFIIPADDGGLLFQSYIESYPILPTPPPPPILKKAKGYFVPPKSQREIISEQRIETEKMELEEAVQAAKMQALKNMAEIESQRESVHLSMGASSKKKSKKSKNDKSKSNYSDTDESLRNSDSDYSKNSTAIDAMMNSKKFTRRRTRKLRKDEIAKEQERMRY